jgi:hypothetical protein
MSILIIDNFLELESLQKIQEIMLGGWFPWYFNDGVSDIDENNFRSYNFQFTHTFFRDDKITSDWFYLLDKILEKLVPTTLLRVKANLLTISEKQEIFDYHVDIADTEKGKTAIFYINSNNGFTVFEDGTKISSVANRIVIFDANVLHTGTTCSDQKTRCVINFNYIE